jgi:hypothetical protein
LSLQIALVPAVSQTEPKPVTIRREQADGNPLTPSARPIRETEASAPFVTSCSLVNGDGDREGPR